MPSPLNEHKLNGPSDPGAAWNLAPSACLQLSQPAPPGVPLAFVTNPAFEACVSLPQTQFPQ